jgi:hypothetical protein
LPAHTAMDRPQFTRSPRNRRSNDHASVHAVHAPKRSRAGPPLEGGPRVRPLRERPSLPRHKPRFPPWSPPPCTPLPE